MRALCRGVVQTALFVLQPAAARAWIIPADLVYSGKGRPVDAELVCPGGPADGALPVVRTRCVRGGTMAGRAVVRDVYPVVGRSGRIGTSTLG
ncbi:MAG: hypothetical protein R6U98_36815 [Pirellulaceae bacterium]